VAVQRALQLDSELQRSITKSAVGQSCGSDLGSRSRLSAKSNDVLCCTSMSFSNRSGDCSITGSLGLHLPHFTHPLLLPVSPTHICSNISHTFEHNITFIAAVLVRDQEVRGKGTHLYFQDADHLQCWQVN
jgi:hypothetical protein